MMENTKRKARNCLVIALAITLNTACIAPPSASHASASKRPNVVVIVADDLGYSDIGAFGGEISTPNLDALAKEGRILSNYHVASTCSPTRAQLLSGADHHLVGFGTMAEDLAFSPTKKGKPGYEGSLNNQAISIAEILKDNGYDTYMVGKWHMGYEARNLPNARGFTRSFAVLQGGSNHFTDDSVFLPPGKKEMPKSTFTEDDKQVPLPKSFYSSNTFTDKMIEYIGDKKRIAENRPFFAYVAYTAPHWPLQAPAEDIAKYAGKYDVGYEVIRERRLKKMQELGVFPADFPASPPLPSTPSSPTWENLSAEEKRVEAKRMEIYAAMVDNMDRNIGRLVQKLKETKEYDNTFIFFMSDNGAEGTSGKGLMEPTINYYDNSLQNMGSGNSFVFLNPRWAEVTAAPFRGKKGQSAEGGISAPAIALLPATIKEKQPYSRALITVKDIAPTLLEFANIPNPGDTYKDRKVHKMSGRSMVSHLTGRAPAVHPEDYVFATELFNRRSVQKGDWKMIWMDQPQGNGSWQLYNIKSDRGETTDLAAQRSEIVKELAEKWDAYVRENGVVLGPYPFPGFINN